MTLVSRIGKFLGYTRPRDRGDVALDLADEVIVQSKSVKEQLRPFAQMDDPFFAIVIRRELANEFEEQAEQSGPRAVL